MGSIRNTILRNIHLVYLSVFFFLLNHLLLTVILKNYSFKTQDSLGYLRLSEDLLQSYLERPNSILQLVLTRTPGYPSFLSVLSDSISMVITAQILIHIIMSLLAVRIVKNLKKISKFTECLIFVLVQLESSLFVYSFRILSEILFAFCILLIILIICRSHLQVHKRLNTFMILVTLFMLFMTRPIAISIIGVFLLMIFFDSRRKFYASLLGISILIVGSYSAFNYAKSKVFTYSLIQNHNLLYWEAVSAKAISKNVDLKVLQIQEKNRAQIKIKNQSDYALVDKYNRARALEILSENKFSFVILHAMGAVKILFGPNRYELVNLVTDENRIKFKWNLPSVIVGFSFALTFLISALGLMASIKYFNKGTIYRVMTLTIITFLVLSGGAQAYGRFRVPIATLLVIYTCIFIEDEIISKNRSKKLIDRISGKSLY